jgi:hypothetical protein
MRTAIALDDNLVRTAQEYSGLVEKSALMREALKALIEREAARSTAHDRSPFIVSARYQLGGRAPDCLYLHYAAYCSLVAR